MSALEPLLAIPPATRFLLIVSVAASLALSTGVLSFDALSFLPLTYIIWSTPLQPRAMAMLAALILLNIYRFFAAFFVVQGLNESGVSVLLNVYKLYFFSNNLENSQGRFRRNFPDYVWFILVCGFFLVAINVAAAPPQFVMSFPHSQLLSCITFMWLRTAMNENIKFLGIVPIKAYYLPFFDLVIAVMGNKWSAFDCVLGILAAYLYECIQSDTLPIYNLIPGAYRHSHLENSNKVGFKTTPSSYVFLPSVFDLGYLKAPAFLYWLLNYPQNSVRTTAFTTKPASGSAYSGARPGSLSTSTGSVFAGKGHRLGDQDIRRWI
ncbi:hypothetical protein METBISCDRAFT_21550 [Metschnikowia bicuspidata]|uniref:Derlin n=1 Tax=Metschnikowia bicuspidata TaxID=27322 RepID=A0A4P9ZIV1_9ASCO|nr:hypothetical protein METBISCDRAFT_21550 [Metschnikowia bicuspidata]